jgi:sugar O-acyltransferase (sialic acid O-acetyltransferase NeuD family)
MIILGAKGFSKQLIELFYQAQRTENLFFFDDITMENSDTLFGIRIIKTIDEVRFIFKNVSDEFCLGIGNPKIRRSLSQKFEELGGRLSTIISPHAFVSFFVKQIGAGSSILTGAIVENDASIGRGSLINCGAIIHHDVHIGEFCEISPGAKVLGQVIMGDNCVVGSNATILPNLKVGSNSIIGAGAVVIKDVPDNVTVVGVPAKQVH